LPNTARVMFLARVSVSSIAEHMGGTGIPETKRLSAPFGAM